MNPIVMTTTNGNDEFYPTPGKLAGMMLAGVDWKKVTTILEPSAGKGDLLKAATKAFYANTGYRSRFEADCIEIDPYLRQILLYNFSRDSVEDLRKRHKELDWLGRNRTRSESEERKQLDRKINAVDVVEMRVVHDDFLALRSGKQYDLILMNPPFANGDLHLLKALELQKNGGQVICLLNAETLRNPYTKTRQLLQRQLREYGAKITFVNDAFKNAERVANVDVVIVKVVIPSVRHESTIYERMKRAIEHETMADGDSSDLIHGNFIELLISQFNIEVAAGTELIREYTALVPYMLQNIPTASNSYYNRPILSMSVGQKGFDDWAEGINRYLKDVRRKYWSALLNNENIVGRLTSQLRSEYSESVHKMADYDFSMFNIVQVMAEINSRIVAGVKETIMSLFDRLTVEHSYYPESKANIHYFNGWKTNKAHKIGKKAIIPVHGIFSSIGRDTFNTHSATETLSDIEKVFNYLDMRVMTHVDLRSIIHRAERNGQTRNIECNYFKVDFYKKGTMHIKFTDQEIMDRFNIYVAQCRNWLPPYYGEVDYDEMPDEGKAVIDSFQGKESYAEVRANKGFYMAAIGENPIKFLSDLS